MTEAIGPYRILGKLGEGGMGEVYRARDTRLARDVAIKVLPPLFAQDPERVARFEREAKTLAALNHPGIAQIYGVEEKDATLALVMELVEGPTLAEILPDSARGLPLDQALRIARQLADAIEAAHEQGIIHRDLKPANIKVRDDGTVKVLDFGLAKAFASDGAGAPADAMNSPTLTAHATVLGMLLGTAAYMAPEQARGKAVDRRADIWSFGVVLLEMLTGTRAFPGDHVSEVLAKVIEREPDLSRLPAATPASLRRLIARCLVKEPKQRLRDIGEARIALIEAERELAEGSVVAVSASPALASPIWRRALPWALVAGLVVALALVLARVRPLPPGAPAITRLQIALPPGVELYTSVGAALSLSPDGTTLAFVGVDHGIRGTFLRRLDRFEIVPIRGTETAVSCVFSPDGRDLLVGFPDTSIRRVRLADKLVEVLAPVTSEFYGGWLTDGRIVFTKEDRLWVQSNAAGAVPTPLTGPGKPSASIDSKPVAVPGTNAIVFTSASLDAPEAGRIDALSLDTMKRTTVVENAASPIITASGLLLFLREGIMLGAPFDARTLTLRGEARPVLRDMSVVHNRGVAAVMSVSNTGTLVYGLSDAKSEIVSVSRNGEERSLMTVAKPAANPRLTRDGRWMLFEEIGGGLWVQDLERRTLERLTDGKTLAAFPIFTRDGREAVFRGANGLFRQPLDGGARASRIAGTQANEYPNGLSPDGATLIYTRIATTTAGDVYEIPLTGGTPKLLLGSSAYEGGAQLSPDGKWLAYVSNERGASDIFLQAYPALDRRIQVSSSGGVQPAWNPKGGEVVYRSGDSLMSVRMTSTPSGPALTPPVALFSGRYAYGGGLTIPNFTVASDGDHFIMVKQQAGASISIVFNWLDELKTAK